MKVYYTHKTIPFSKDELFEMLHNTGDNILSIEKYEVPISSTVDPMVLLRDDDLEIYISDSLIQEMEFLDTLSLGIILFVDRKLVASIDSEFANNPESVKEYFIQGLATPFLCAIISTYGLDHNIALNVAKHEFGHFYGLPHCDGDCVMQNYEKELINSKLCSKCEQKLRDNLVI